MAAVQADQLGDSRRVVLLAGADAALKRAVRERLSRAPGPRGAARYRLVSADRARDVRRSATEDVTAAAIDLSIGGASGLDVIRALRDRRPDLAILAFSRRASTSDAIASMMAGADFFHDSADGSPDRFVRALELAIDHRVLTRLIERNEEETEAARRKLAQLSGDLVRAVPGFRPLHAPEDVLPFREAARRYLLAAAQLFEGDARGLAGALGVSYFALRRLLARYEVPFPAARSRR
jgi:DNA-binding NarL/FixJ family response regulator